MKGFAVALGCAAASFGLAWACTPTPQQKAQIAQTGPPAEDLLFCVLGHVPQCLRSGQAWAVCAVEAAHACSADEAEIWKIWAAHVRAIYQDTLGFDDGGAARRSEGGGP
jgi:hypothetical protein